MKKTFGSDEHFRCLQSQGYGKLKDVLREKKIHDWAYFVVGYAKDGEEDLPGSGLYIAGYRPYSDYTKFNIKKRGYSRIVVKPDEELLAKYFSPQQVMEINRVAKQKIPGEKRFEKAQLYLMEDAFIGHFSLEMENQDWLNPKKVKSLVNRNIENRRLQDYSEPELYLYSPRESNGYFLEGKDYVVWVVIVGVQDTYRGEYKKRSLCIDVLSGSVCVVPFSKDDQVDFRFIP